MKNFYLNFILIVSLVANMRGSEQPNVKSQCDEIVVNQQLEQQNQALIEPLKKQLNELSEELRQNRIDFNNKEGELEDLETKNQELEIESKFRPA